MSYHESGGGYYVKYKNKIEDTYSPNWFEAKKFTSLGSALDRLGVNIKISDIISMDKFFEHNLIDHKKMNRENALSTVLGLDKNVGIIFNSGYIDKISDRGEFIGRADEEVLEYIQHMILRNKGKQNSKVKTFDKLLEGKKYITETKEGEDFWG